MTKHERRALRENRLQCKEKRLCIREAFRCVISTVFLLIIVVPVVWFAYTVCTGGN